MTERAAEREPLGRVVRPVVPLAVADFADGMAFGALAVSIGLGVLAPVVMSLLVFSGSAQYGAIAVLGHDGSLWAVVGTAAALNARYLLMGTTIAPALTGSPWSRVGRALLITDGSWAVAHRGGGRYDMRVLTVAGLLCLCGWTAGTALGAVLGGAIGDPARFGLDAAYPVFFLGLLRSQLTSGRAWSLAAVGVAAVAGLAPFTPPGIPVLLAGAAGAVAGAVLGARR
ncbi:AzlC family ABC transporter permease [Saccharothrix coeruleofusca]|uniref:Branched-chain amino acid ABC transporter permease n=1 Tax=Saccharothrix coeruleofusca TaxID=33919 RepID=A0A918EG62_9PSEU|nr:AzlC family ABC transporter permease [Saccharothrix coeruleofusca]MBP2336691.1 putative branched-subunit amino acid permease [Saccharothrix coeruleofusca]GGP78710.1 branched-chain amino acid ABC transporter permease [Saccharothrix coeruleofusca]